MKNFYKVTVSVKGFKPQNGVLIKPNGVDFIIMENGTSGEPQKMFHNNYIIARNDSLKLNVPASIKEFKNLKEFTMPTFFGKVWSEELGKFINI